MQQLELALTTDVPYTVRHNGRARRLRLSVTATGRVEVVAPRRTGGAAVAAFVASHADWIRRQVARVQAEGRYDPDGRAPLPGGIDLPAVDERWALRLDGGVRRQWKESGATLSLYGTGGDPVHAKVLLRRWLAHKGRRHLLPWLDALARELDLTYRRGSVRGQRSRWGSCSAQGTVSLNYALLFLPPRLVRYLLIHELCHTVHLHHGPAYWTLVARHESDWRALDRELRRSGRQVPPWVTEPRTDDGPS